ncbi:hypothetical protein C8J57DRAFT_1261573 [Mycena rebaudengoi]|nr:hypothetical protein C8J57DRAFT_1261573 [Mycena rebaudengoi]
MQSPPANADWPYLTRVERGWGGYALASAGSGGRYADTTRAKAIAPHRSIQRSIQPAVSMRREKNSSSPSRRGAAGGGRARWWWWGAGVGAEGEGPRGGAKDGTSPWRGSRRRARMTLARVDAGPREGAVVVGAKRGRGGIVDKAFAGVGGTEGMGGGVRGEARGAAGAVVKSACPHAPAAKSPTTSPTRRHHRYDKAHVLRQELRPPVRAAGEEIDGVDAWAQGAHEGEGREARRVDGAVAREVMHWRISANKNLCKEGFYGYPVCDEQQPRNILVVDNRSGLEYCVPALQRERCHQSHITLDSNFELCPSTLSTSSHRLKPIPLGHHIFQVKYSKISAQKISRSVVHAEE